MVRIGINITMAQYKALKKRQFIKLLPKHLEDGPFLLIANLYTESLFQYALDNNKSIVWTLHDDESMSVMVGTDKMKELNS